MQVKLKKEDFQAMAAHAVAHLPEEACGLIAGEKSDTERVIKKVYYLTNIDHTNEHFSLDPKEQLAAIKDCLLYTSPSPRDGLLSRMPSSA